MNVAVFRDIICSTVMEVKHAWFIQNFGYVLEKAGLLPHLKKQQK